MNGTPNRMKALLARVASSAPLNLAEARDAFEIMMSGDATPAQVGGFLMGLRVRGETVDELAGGAQAPLLPGHQSIWAPSCPCQPVRHSIPAPRRLFLSARHPIRSAQLPLPDVQRSK